MLPPLFIHTASRFSYIYDFKNMGLTPSAGSNSFAANQAYFVPVKIPLLYPMKRIFLWNGSTANGNIDLGLYSRDGVRVCSTGSVAQAGTSVPQYVNLPFLVPPDSYYFAVACNSATGTMQRMSISLLGAAWGRMSGLLMQSSAFPLPATMSPAVSTSIDVPLMGITLTESGF